MQITRDYGAFHGMHGVSFSCHRMYDEMEHHTNCIELVVVATEGQALRNIGPTATLKSLIILTILGNFIKSQKSSLRSIITSENLDSLSFF